MAQIARFFTKDLTFATEPARMRILQTLMKWHNFAFYKLDKWFHNKHDLSLSPQMLLEENTAIHNKIPAIFLPLLAKRLKEVDQAIMPGLTTLSWTSMNLEVYFFNVKSKLIKLDLLIKKVPFPNIYSIFMFVLPCICL